MENRTPSLRFSSLPKSDRDSLSRSILTYGTHIFNRNEVKEEFALWLKQKTGTQSGKTYDACSLREEAILIIRRNHD